MAQASASAIVAPHAFTLGGAPVVQRPFRPFYSNCTSFGPSELARDVFASLLDELTRRGGVRPPLDVQKALGDLIATMAAMADRTATSVFALSSLDPGVGKTTAFVHFVQGLLKSETHRDVAVLVCLPRLEEIARLVEEMGLAEPYFAVFSADRYVNQLSSTPCGDARILFTTHSMVRSRCRGGRFRDTEVFHYRGEVRTVRIWDEEMLPGEVVSMSTDQLAALRDPLRVSHPALAGMVERLERKLKALTRRSTLAWPDIEDVTGISYWSARQGLDPRHSSYVEALYALSGQHVLLRKPNPASPVITALNSRDALPDDLAPIVVLDASGRVRKTYEQWEKSKGNLVRLGSAVRDYRNLKVHIMNKGSGKTAWTKNGDALARDIAQLINSKPDEEWLIIYHKGVRAGAIPDHLRGLLNSEHDRVHFLNWGKHQGTNEYRHIKNVILAGMNNHPETDYEMKARHYSGTSNDQDVSQTLIDEMKVGEHQHHILQAICRSAVRESSGSECGHSNVYIIAPQRSGIRTFLPEVFPGCKVTTWSPVKRKAPTGWVAAAIAKIETHFRNDPEGVYLYQDLRTALGITDASNFNKRVRRHESFKAALERMGVEEAIIGSGHYYNALTLTWRGISRVETYNSTANISA